LKVGDRVLQPGEFVPEAAGWPNLGVYLNNQHLDRVELGTAEYTEPLTESELLALIQRADLDKAARKRLAEALLFSPGGDDA
jgi:hypothetical protein